MRNRQRKRLQHFLWQFVKTSFNCWIMRNDNQAHHVRRSKPRMMLLGKKCCCIQTSSSSGVWFNLNVFKLLLVRISRLEYSSEVGWLRVDDNNDNPGSPVKTHVCWGNHDILNMIQTKTNSFSCFPSFSSSQQLTLWAWLTMFGLIYLLWRVFNWFSS